MGSGTPIRRRLLPQLRLMGEKPTIGVCQAVAQVDPGAPAQGRKAR
ncbi:MAG: hypothetical protein ACD_54C00582G0001, partial [uncultured bacterium]